MDDSMVNNNKKIQTQGMKLTYLGTYILQFPGLRMIQAWRILGYFEYNPKIPITVELIF